MAFSRSVDSFFRNNQQFVLTGVNTTGKILATGSYCSVEELTYKHISCAGKKIYEQLIDVENEGVAELVHKFLKECQLMSSLHHPNITQFLGLCFLPGTRLPLLVTERLETSLDNLLEHIPGLPISLKRSVLEDVASGLLYLHERPSPVIHRDLTARNVLLTSSLVAKISDMGQSCIVDSEIDRALTRVPGTLVYMPPEALNDTSCYGTSLDIFSFGHLALFTVIQKFPGDLLPGTFCDPDNIEVIRGRSELERRGKYIELLDGVVGLLHPALAQLVKQCLHNAPHKRPSTDELLARLQEMKVEVEGEYGGSPIRLDMVRVRLAKEVKVKDSRIEAVTQQQALMQEECEAELERMTREFEELIGDKQLRETQTREELQSKDAEIRRLREELWKNQQEMAMQVKDIMKLESDNELLRERLKSQPTRTFRTVHRADVTINKVLAGGSWGTVSAGEFGGCKVAIKQPHKWIMHENTVARMKREARNMAVMHHPNLITFIGAVFDDNYMYEEDKLPMIIIEIMDANLRATYEKTVLTKDHILSIFKDVTYALHYLHEFREPIIHRDLSAPNVLLKSLPGNRYIAKVSDFGSANLAKHAATGGEGAIIYSAPESFPPPDDGHPRAKQTVKMDSYSYGILLCEVINRKLPDPENRGKMVAAVAGKWGSMHNLVVWCIKHHPRERPSMSEILHYLCTMN